ncbi:uncharacterized protein LOC7460272 isoform X2 [Populus trichocarpa]|uniref:uncharacterized protein LOC7460272 isoform X2 n=1 Tax=Populus trichocarpa TaxID=3694 RepID=UPI000D1897BE|nr:uncharacterized protein LOC7460272 isoform X2 [Populus trichocarpa]|eukprot:XP_024454085.1 uncharacterized protein LOC7460272 isoform X2 [Populus trichocarpa]
MSPASKSNTKSKDKTSAKSAIEQPKASVKSSGSTNSVTGNPANAYNPISGTFHTLEIPAAAAFPPLHDNGRFRNIDDTDEHSSSPHGTVSEYDSVSNNGSCSGESEDIKEKIINSTRQETIPGLDSDRREKIRQRNEKKHQRQRERRAQELHDRCSGYLMSRKLERLSQQLVAMGFSHERAILALMLNEGRVEESVNWLFEGSEEEAQKDSKLESGGNLKIDINEELAQISAMEMRYKCSKQEVERAVVACEGDLVKAEETLQPQKQEPPATPPRQEYTADTNNLRRLHEKPVPVTSVTAQQRMNEQDFNYKTAIPVPTYSEPGSRNLQPLNQPKPLADKRWGATGSSPAFSSSMGPSMQVAPPSTKLDVQLGFTEGVGTTGSSSAFSSSMGPSMQVAPPSTKLGVQLGFTGNERKNVQQIVREPVSPQSMNAKQNTVPYASATPSVTAGWYSNNVPGVEHMRSNVKLLSNQSTGSLGLVNQSSQQFYHPVSYKQNPFPYSGPVNYTSNGLGGTRSPSLTVPSQLQGSYGKTTASLPSLAAPSSLGLFIGWGSAGTLGSSHVDWNTGGLMSEFDYTSIDWTLDSNMLSSKSNGLWLGLSSLLRNTSSTRTSSTNSSFLSGLRDSGVAKETSSSAGSREWTSPFAGKDIFSLPRQFVTSPSP